MAFSELEAFGAKRRVKAFIERLRPALEIRPELDYGYRLDGQSVILFEIRPRWDHPEEILEGEFAKATYVRSQTCWKVYWQRADMKWHLYEPAPEVATIEAFIALVEADEYGAFFG